jgi:hypothetical protein
MCFRLSFGGGVSTEGKPKTQAEFQHVEIITSFVHDTMHAHREATQRVVLV